MAAVATAADVEQLIVRKFREKYSSLREAFQSMDIRGDSLITRVELQSGLASKFDLTIADDLAEALVARYNRTPPGGTPAFNYDSFADMYEGAFSQFLPSSIGSAAVAGADGISRAFDFVTGQHNTVAVSPTQEQQALSVIRRIGQKLRQHASSSVRSRHFTELFVAMDTDRTGFLSADEIGLGMWQLGLDLSPADLNCLFDAIDTQYVGKISIANFMLLIQRGTGVDAAPREAAEAAAEAPVSAELPPQVSILGQ
jgi:Ca2+-binding EF-hand superfamily protein